ncbi:cadherin domain protein [Ostertagia ostertagi]
MKNVEEQGQSTRVPPTHVPLFAGLNDDPSTLHIEGGYSAFGVDTEASTNVDIRIVPVELALIDYEKRKAFELYVTSPSGRCQINVDVIDVNDNAPKCVHDTFTFYVTENHKPVVLGEVTDPSTLHIEGGYSAFGVDTEASTNVDIRIVPVELALIDYEKRKAFELYVTSPSGRCQINVDVIDVNDNAPKCVHDTFTFYVTENHKPVVLGEVTATDADSAIYSPIRYSIHGEGAELFAISEEGEFRSLLPIDREEHDKFELTVRATDAGGKSTDCPGKVVVRDINDNTPTFEHSEYLIEIEEEKTLKQKLEASDPDIGENGEIVYTLENVPQGLAVEASAGILFIGKLDRDTMDSDSVRFVLRATDRGHPPRTSVTNVTINVKAKEDGQQGMETVEELRVRAQQRDVAEEQVNGDLCNGKVYLATIKEGEPDFEEPLVIRLSKPTDPSTLHIEGGYSAFGVDTELYCWLFGVCSPVQTLLSESSRSRTLALMIRKRKASSF